MSKLDNVSKYISLILRHKPEVINASLEKEGWMTVEDLINGINKTRPKFNIDMKMLEEIVITDSKQRYSFNEDKTKIRANQGHSVKSVDITFRECTPPDILYHGTATRFLNQIKSEGIKSMSRNYVHLSKDYETAVKVGKRHGDVIVLKIDTKTMDADGIKFYLSENGVWLTNFVDKKYILN